jgi:hypothetical protein
MLTAPPRALEQELARFSQRLKRFLWREVLRGNTRLRAWRALGVPLSGAWEWRGDCPILYLRCERCGREAKPQRYAPGADFTIMEVAAAAWLLEPRHGEVSGCGHLAPLLAEPPAEFFAIYALELLAGT